MSHNRMSCTCIHMFECLCLICFMHYRALYFVPFNINLFSIYMLHSDFVFKNYQCGLKPFVFIE
jgi:hypothetical protein